MKAITADLLALVASGSLLGIKLHANAQNTTKMAKATATVTYKAHCGMGYSAADAKKNHYISLVSGKIML
jgi:hypothetical protein